MLFSEEWKEEFLLCIFRCCFSMFLMQMWFLIKAQVLRNDFRCPVEIIFYHSHLDFLLLLVLLLKPIELYGGLRADDVFSHFHVFVNDFVEVVFHLVEVLVALGVSFIDQFVLLIQGYWRRTLLPDGNVDQLAHYAFVDSLHLVAFFYWSFAYSCGRKETAGSAVWDASGKVIEKVASAGSFLLISSSIAFIFYSFHT